MKEKFRNIRNTRINKNDFKKYALPVAGLLIVGFLVISFLRNNSSSTAANNDITQLPPSIAKTNLGNSFDFPIRDSEGNEVSLYKITVENASLEKEIVVKGKRNKAIAGRVFLILNLKIQNQFGRPIDIHTRDYFRVVVNGNEEERLAPEIHNDPVTVQAISTKLTRVGFTLYETDQNITLYVGEINGEKQRIDINLQAK